VYAVILAGGKGARLWPLSTPEHPKPFLRLLGEDTLIQSCVARILPLLEPDDIYVVAERHHLDLARQQLPQIPAANLLGEPVGRNTAAAVAFAAEAIDRPEGEVMLILPADAHVADEVGLRRALTAAAEAAAGERLVTLGVTPDRPETGYGYILARPPARMVAGERVLDVERFVEKPTASRASQMISTGLASWNAGIFAWRRGAIRARLEHHAPDIGAPIRAAFAAGGPDDAALQGVYPSLRATSIDYAVLEPASLDGAVSVVPVDVGWSDLGSWSALRDAWQRQGGARSVAPGMGNRRDRGSRDCLVFAGDRPVVTIGLRDTIVVDTPDAVLVCSADRAQDVKAIAEELAEEGPS
jgi:mannose-1-phosphate guanylyltransferase